ncbi:hypothetical protein HHL24_23825 [Paraburkholderia sp. RP-4-7]|uniref:Uncharacterized protein n=1 Tax=Paraburkholderia polaris TaxID=2728848 RepID=A0A848IMB0_9BURK|nr:hypothetical protein [Paraburkholderia polaris]
MGSKTVLLINYDENDGFFDHVAPPFAPASSAVSSCHCRPHRRALAHLLPNRLHDKLRIPRDA